MERKKQKSVDNTIAAKKARARDDRNRRRRLTRLVYASEEWVGGTLIKNQQQQKWKRGVNKPFKRDENHSTE